MEMLTVEMELIQMKRQLKIKIWHIIAVIGLLMCLLFGFGFRTLAAIPLPQAPDAAAILDKAAAAYAGAGGVSASFTLRTHADATQTTESFEGTLDMKGEKFVLNTPDMITWFDGHTQWTYVGRNDEVNISNPTGDELQFTNPALLLHTYKKGYTPVYKGESTAPNGKAAYDIELTPKKKGDILKVALQIEKRTHYPASITLESKNGVRHTIRIGKLQTNVNQPDSFFVFKEADFPDAEIIDLR